MTIPASAFDHPEQRSRATATTHLLDRLIVRDYLVNVEIGAFEAERNTTQRVSFNIVVELTPTDEAISDNVDRILSYDRLTDAVDYELKIERVNLLETLAERIAQRILCEPLAKRVFVRIEKLDRGPGALGVEIMRDHPAADTLDDLKARVSENILKQTTPIVIFVPKCVVETHEFASVMQDHVVQSRVPLIFCVEYGEDLPSSGTVSESDKRIDLLKVEQAAWEFHARFPFCVTRSSRTELEWAASQYETRKELSVFAPYRMVLESQTPPEIGALNYAIWVSARVNTAELVVLKTGSESNTNAQAIREVSLDAFAKYLRDC